MPDQLTNYQCPACGGPLHFDANKQKLLCDYCGSEYTNEEIRKIYADKLESAAAQGTETHNVETLQWTEEEAKHMRAYSCPSCGAQLICDENTAATSCPYCDNPTVVPAQFAGSLKPDYVIPFKLDKDAAVKKLSSFYSGKPLLPNAFKSQNHIEDIKGVYVPFWLYDGRAHVDAAYHATRAHTHSTHDEHITVTEHFRLIRKGSVEFEMVPADASSKMPDEFMDAIEPYDYADMVAFDMGYLPGYLADKYDVTAEENENRIETRMKNSAISEIRGTTSIWGAAVPEQEYVGIHPGNVRYAFLPVWMLSTRWNGKTFLFAMNGQTGKMVGDLPTDYGKMVFYFLAIMLGLMALFFILFHFVL